MANNQSDPNAPIPPAIQGLTPEQITERIRAITQGITPGPTPVYRPTPVPPPADLPPIPPFSTPAAPGVIPYPTAGLVPPRTYIQEGPPTLRRGDPAGDLEIRNLRAAIGETGYAPTPGEGVIPSLQPVSSIGIPTIDRMGRIRGPQVQPGEPIPSDLMHAAGRAAYEQMRPQVTAPAGSAEANQQRQQQILFDREHHFGADISPMPGTMGKILHGLSIAGNIAGDVLRPQAMVAIPGTQMHQAAELRNLQEEEPRQVAAEVEQARLPIEREQAATEAARAKTAAAAEQLEEQKLAQGVPESLQQSYANAVQDAINRKVDPATDPTAQAYGDAIRSIQKEAAEKTPPHITVMGPDRQPHVMQRDPQTGRYSIDLGVAPPTYAMIAPNLQQQRMQAQTKTLVGPDGMAHDYGWNARTRQFDIDMGVSGTGTQGSRLFAAGISKQAGELLIHDIEANEDKLGTVATWVKQYGLNTPLAADIDPTGSLSRLQAELASFAALQPAQHGFRSQNAMEAFEKIIGGLQRSPKQTIEAIRGITATTSVMLPGQGGAGAGATPGHTGPGKEGEYQRNTDTGRVEQFRDGRWQ